MRRIQGAVHVFNTPRVPWTVPVTAVNFRSFEARRYQDVPPGGQVRVDHNSNISLVTKESDEKIRVEFAYTTSYGPLGLIKIEGNLVYTGKGAGEGAEAWAKDRNLPTDIAQHVHSAIMASAVPQAVGLAKDLRMPPPIPLPQVQIKGKGAGAPTAGKGPDKFSPEIG
jgi:hypothetical protein